MWLHVSLVEKFTIVLLSALERQRESPVMLMLWQSTYSEVTPPLHSAASFQRRHSVLRSSES